MNESTTDMANIEINGSTADFTLNADFAIGISNPLILGQQQPSNSGYIQLQGTTTAGKGNGDIWKGGNAGASIAAGNIVYLSTANTWTKAQADSRATSAGLVGVALGTSPTTNGVLLRGMINLSGMTVTTGQPIYISPSSAGAFTSTIPTTGGDIVRILGYSMYNASGYPLNVMFFNPDTSFIEL